MAAPSFKVESLPIGDVFVVGDRRPVDDGAVTRLVESIRQIELQTPITVRIGDVSDDQGEVLGAYILIAGRHRLEAFRRMGETRIPAIVRDCDEVDAELWEISENLHRADLSKEQRDAQIRRFAELLERKQEARQGVQIEHPVMADGRRKGAQHQKSISRQVAEQTGISLTTVKRARGQIAPPAPAEDDREQRRKRAMSAWNKLDDEDREWFRDWIDTPIMDARHAA